MFYGLLFGFFFFLFFGRQNNRISAELSCAKTLIALHNVLEQTALGEHKLSPSILNSLSSSQQTEVTFLCTARTKEVEGFILEGFCVCKVPLLFYKMKTSPAGLQIPNKMPNCCQIRDSISPSGMGSERQNDLGEIGANKISN